MEKVIRKGFWNARKEEDWINEMAASGMSLVEMRWMRYRFEETEPGKYLYRIDLSEHASKSEKAKTYIGFLRDSGIEVVSTYGRWLYLRKPATDGSFDVYSDAESKIAYYRRVEKFWGALALFELCIGFLNITVDTVNLIHVERMGMFSVTGIILGSICLILGLVILLFVYRPVRGVRKKLEKDRLIYD
ncbi:MAG: DUF2812 domain-containing protein [Clostridiales bacterium]|nr:DUF2812 domain-containing protein [Clostridiales bacterium]